MILPRSPLPSRVSTFSRLAARLRALGLPCAVILSGSALLAAPRIETNLSGDGWSLLVDTNAPWKSDRLFFPAPNLASLPTHAPTQGWDAIAGKASLPVRVPGTTEEYTQKTPGPEGDYQGVSWWTRSIRIPAEARGRRVLLRFEGVRERAEIYINRRLAGYDLVGSTPFEVDATSFVTPGQSCDLSVRVTDPGGNFDWRDSRPMTWGDYRLPMSHGFGGITGRVRLVVCDPVFVDDLYVQNTPEITKANAVVALRNTSPDTVRGGITLRVTDRASGETVFSARLSDVEIEANARREVQIPLRVPAAQLWSPDSPHLYVCEVALQSGDSDRRVFGFRWFAMDGLGRDAVLRLNGKRIVLRTAISWGFWPSNGICPTEELAERQVRTAKELGLNMLNFHRAIGNPIVLEKADELGLLYYEEPGAFKSVSSDGFGYPIVREKLLRMVRRDRSHPSLVLYNLINEWDSRNPHPSQEEIARHEAAMAAAHAVDPSRLITHTSAWARGNDIDDPAKLHFRPFDPKPYLNGWYDVHHAGGPAVWNESLYRSPAEFYGQTDNTKEVVYWGEEGALSTPPRLEKIERELSRTPHPGWDGALYREWFRAFDAFLTEKKLRDAFPSVDALTTAMGAVSLGHQGRRIENIRMSNIADGYAINGWESEIVENHSGIVDCFRNPKADPAILAYYNQPLYVAVKARTSVLAAPGKLVADFFIVNELGLQGPHTLRVVLRGSNGRDLASAERKVVVQGGDTYGQLLAEGLEFPVGAGDLGELKLEASLADAGGQVRATGHDSAWSVNWRAESIAGKGAVWETDGQIRRFLSSGLGIEAPAYASSLGALDWIVVSAPPLQGQPVAIPPSQFHQPERGRPGLLATFFADRELEHPIFRRTDAQLQYAVEDGAAPDPALSVMTNYGVRWEGALTPVRNGNHVFVVRASGGVRLSVGNTVVIDAGAERGIQSLRGAVDLKAGTPVRIAVELRQAKGDARCELAWVPPTSAPPLSAEILRRVAQDGTRLVILDHAELWMPLLAEATGGKLRYRGLFKVGRTWLGGVHFVGHDRLLSGLPIDGAMDWPYQGLVRNGDERLGLQLEGEDLIAGCYHSYPMRLGTVVGRVAVGRGQVIFSTLDVTSNLNANDGPSEAARKLFFNFLRD
ncbi:hypothetical protein DB347_15230 [Opitutaceae bacterium EW11]|nr:hypothetical protein DB347_15230 [Opitutaceae bacterium EW11]